MFIIVFVTQKILKENCKDIMYIHTPKKFKLQKILNQV